ncbi:MAG TPA: hypothetical protein PKY82_35305, partial [Pyrinomonadaceae bacterium]|nr:hypothetical protein [Pyrinomonadaceae bacterium]
MSKLVLIFLFILNFLLTGVIFGQTELNLGPRLKKSPDQQKIVKIIEDGLKSINRSATDLEKQSSSATSNEELEFWATMSQRLKKLSSVAFSKYLVFELGCPSNVRGCVTWTRVDNSIRIRLGFGFTSHFPKWTNFEWLELIAHELNHVADIIESFESNQKLFLLKTEANSFLVSGIIARDADETLVHSGVTLCKKGLGKKPFRQQRDFLEAQVA